MKTIRTLAGVLLAAAMAVSSPSPASAMSMLDIDISALAGTISYGGGVAPLVGTGIVASLPLSGGRYDPNIVGTGLPGTLKTACVGCVLNFVTAEATGSTGMKWTFAPGGTIELRGTVPGAGITVADTLLLRGTITKATVSTTNVASNTKEVTLLFTDTKNPTLLEFFGLPTGVDYVGSLWMSFSALDTKEGGYESRDMLGGDLTNMPTPEPASLLLLGSGLAGAGFMARRRARKAKA